MTAFCSRGSCDVELADPDGGFCSDECRDMHAALERLPPIAGNKQHTEDAAVRHALPWMDPRATRDEQAAS